MRVARRISRIRCSKGIIWSHIRTVTSTRHRRVVFLFAQHLPLEQYRAIARAIVYVPRDPTAKRRRAGGDGDPRTAKRSKGDHPAGSGDKSKRK